MYWGKASDPKEVLQGAPVMIGNRRQGPDLTHISGRRSDAWLREHFLDPRLLAPHSTMPRYAHLFEDQCGSDLIAFLTRDRDRALRMTQEHWQNVVIETEGSADVALGKKLFAAHCRACHGDEGRGDGPLARKLTRPVTNLVHGPFLWTQGSTTRDAALIAKVIRYGIPGTDMPGHETWDDHNVRSLLDYVMQLYAPATR
jgi:cytochrome c oxidase cbb3-type subunit 2